VCLPDIFIFQLGVFVLKFFPVRIYGYRIDYPAHCQSHPSDTGLAIHDLGINCNAVKFHSHQSSPQVLYSFQRNLCMANYCLRSYGQLIKATTM
jgi:hypothetical protein